MATKSLLLSCLLMGSGVAQHPASGAVQTEDAHTFSSETAGYTTNTVLSHLQDYNECDVLLLEEVAKIYCFCGLHSPDWPEPTIPEKCEAVPGLEEFTDLIQEKCPDEASSICAQAQYEVHTCTSCPRDPRCQVLSRLLKRHDVPFWDDNKANNKSCPYSPGDDPDKSHHHRRDATAFVFRSTLKDSLERRDADEPYHSALKPIHEDCDVFEDPFLHLECATRELKRTMCEQEPWNQWCQDVLSGNADELLVMPVTSRLETVAPGPTETASFADWDAPSRRRRAFLRECMINHVTHYQRERCVLAKIDEVCFNNPGDELCEVPRPTLIHQRDLPLHTNTAEFSE